MESLMVTELISINMNSRFHWIFIDNFMPQKTSISRFCLILDIFNFFNPQEDEGSYNRVFHGEGVSLVFPFEFLKTWNGCIFPLLAKQKLKPILVSTWLLKTAQKSSNAYELWRYSFFDIRWFCYFFNADTKHSTPSRWNTSRAVCVCFLFWITTNTKTKRFIILTCAPS